MTNAPKCRRHLTNLKNFVKIFPVNADLVTVGSKQIILFGPGLGLLGIPDGGLFDASAAGPQTLPIAMPRDGGR